MSILVICAQCQAELEVNDAAAGKKGRCPACQAVMDIPRPSANGDSPPASKPDTIVVHCGECGLPLEVAATSAGKKGRCPHCKAIMPIPRLGASGTESSGDSIVVTCRECQTTLQVSASAAGKKGKCPNCQAVMPIPAPTGTSSAAAEVKEQRVAEYVPPRTSDIRPLISDQPASTEPKRAESSQTTRYVPAASAKSTTPDKPATETRPTKVVDEDALLQLPPVEPLPSSLEVAATAASQPPIPAPPLVDRSKPAATAMPSVKPVPPQLIRPPVAATAPQLARTAPADPVELQAIEPMAAASATPEPMRARSNAPPVMIKPPVGPTPSSLPQPASPALAPAVPATASTAPTIATPATGNGAGAQTNTADPKPTAASAQPKKPPPQASRPPVPSAGTAKPASTKASTPAIQSAGAAATTPVSQDQLAAQILGAFSGPIARTPPSLSYKLGILLTSGVMIVVPLIYIGLILFVALLVFWHLTASSGMLTAVSGRGQAFAVILYLAPAVLGVLLVLFMVKPLFAPAGNSEKTRTLTRDAEPLLFAFVERVCAAVNSPVPSQIEVCCDVNAGARLQGVSSGNLALQIGMPLVAGLSLQQFAGVLAHEFGHFSQGAGMRLTYLTRTIDMWLIRVVYERDRWDDWLDTAANSVHVSFGLVLHLLRFLIWGTRWILRLLLYVGHAVTGFMLREMEYDADRFEARLAGSQTFEATVRQLIYLNLAYRGAMADLENFYRDGRLADNLPRLIIANVAQLPEEARKFADELIEETETGMFDSHPADRDRIASAKAENSSGVFQSRLPATALFQDFDALAKAVTWDLYSDMFGAEFKPTAVRPIEEMLERQSREDQIYEAMKRFLLDSFQVLRPLRLPDWQLRPPTDPGEMQNRLAWARNEMHNQIAAYNQAWEWYDKADTHVIQMRQLVPLMRCYANIMGDKFDAHPPSAEAAGFERDRAYADMNHLDAQLIPLETAAGQRLYAALSLLYCPQFSARLADARELVDHCQRLMPLVGRINAHLAQIVELRNNHGILAALTGHIEINEKNETLFHEVVEQLNRTQRQLRDLWAIFQREAYPFDHHEGFMSISQFLLKELPQENELGSTLDGIDQLLGNLASIYRRSLARLCYIAERVETALGWDPLPLPEKPQPQT